MVLKTLISRFKKVVFRLDMRLWTLGLCVMVGSLNGTPGQEVFASGKVTQRAEVSLGNLSIALHYPAHQQMAVSLQI